jgi:hypothetical protein
MRHGAASVGGRFQTPAGGRALIGPLYPLLLWFRIDAKMHGLNVESVHSIFEIPAIVSPFRLIKLTDHG